MSCRRLVSLLSVCCRFLNFFPISFRSCHRPFVEKDDNDDGDNDDDDDDGGDEDGDGDGMRR